jgi:hypothetical protein
MKILLGGANSQGLNCLAHPLFLPGFLPHCIMIADASQGVVNDSVSAAGLNGDVETLTSYKNAVKCVPLGEAFEHAINILTLIKVGLLILSPFFRLLICPTNRMRRYRMIRS